MVRISIASGKGGTGKTLVATNLAAVAGDATLLDLDVEEPNCHLFFCGEENSRETVNRKVPFVREEACTHCGNCAKVCEYHAIVSLPRKVFVFEELCHGCGACSMFCPENAIEERDYPIGEIVRVCAPPLQSLVYGQLRVGEASAARLIKSVKKSVPDRGLTIVDCPPGTACPAVEGVRGSDLCVLVTEPTPFGLHDLKLTLDVTHKLKVPSVVLINKAGLPGPDIWRFCSDAGVGVVGEIPMRREIAETYSEGKLLASDPVMRRIFNSTLRKIMAEVGEA
ncbi:MAG: ATP-binding protein [Thermoplasmata archaeon]